MLLTISALTPNHKTGSKWDHGFAWWDAECLEVGLSWAFLF